MRHKLVRCVYCTLVVTSVISVMAPIGIRALVLPSSPRRTPRATTVEVPVLLFHYVRPLPENDELGVKLTVTPPVFVDQLTYLVQHGYHPISTDELCAAVQSRGVVLPKKPVVLTFDDGTEDFYTTVFPTLRAFGIPATVYMVAAFTGTHGYLTWNQLRTLGTSSQILIGGHGLNHVSLTTLPNAVAQDQLTLTRNMLMHATGQPINTFAYPNGAVNDTIARMAPVAGYSCAFSTRTSSQHTLGQRYVLPRIHAGSSVQSLADALTR